MDDLVPSPNVALIQASEVPSLLAQVRPTWQARDLIGRVQRLLQVDPSSACQRLFNVAIHDLRDKVIVAGIDIAREAAKQYKLPPVERQEDVENYSTAKLIDLAHRIGLLSRPEWRRLSRCYEIRRDLEHEDDEYEAGVEDCVYIFKTCIDVVLSKDPIHLLRVTDVRELVQQPAAVFPAPSLLEDYEHAPQPRQEEIQKFLVSIALDETQADLVRQNAFALLTYFQPLSQNAVKLALAAHLQEKITRAGPTRVLIRVAFAAGVLPYIKQAHLRDFFARTLAVMRQTGTSWRAHPHHGELLRSFKEIGGLTNCPADVRQAILKWLVLTYLGETGGRTSYGHVRPVFYSDTAAPLIEELIQESATIVAGEVAQLENDRDIQRLTKDQHIARRFQALLDLLPDDKGR